MSTSSELWVILGYPADPIPGDPGVVRHYAAEYTKVAQAIKDASTRLRGIAHDKETVSEFIDKFKGQAGEVADQIDKAHARYKNTADAVSNYADPLEDAQNRADAALRKAQAAYDSHSGSALLVEKYQNELTYNSSLSESDKQHYTQLLHHAQTQTNDNLQEINDAKAMLQSAIDSRDDAANRASSLIENISLSGSITDDAWQRFWDKNKTLIDNIVTVLEIVATVVLVVLMFIPGVNAIVLAIMIVVAVVEIAKAAMEWSAGVESPGAALLDIGLALVPFAGMAAGKLACKLAISAAIKTSMASKAGQSISGFTRSEAAMDLIAKIDTVADNSASGVAKTIFKAVVTNGPDKVEMLQNIAKAAITVNGASERVAGIATKGAWVVRLIPGPAPELLLEDGLHRTLDPIFDKMSGMSG